MAWHSFAPIVRRHGIARRVAALLLAGVLPIASASMVLAQEKAAAQPINDRGYGVFIAEASQRFGIPADWIRAVMHAESEHVDDVSSAGAVGLMQIMPDTWTELRRRYSLGADPFDPRDNIVAGTGYLRELLDRYGNVGAMLAAYNAGPARYDDYLATGRPLPAGTRDYVTKLAPLMGENLPPEVSAAALSRPSDWRDAPLFAEVDGGGSPTGKPLVDGQSAAVSRSRLATGDIASSTPSNGLFVPLSGRSSTP
jgi:muramidase (phage lysozyme)